MIQKVINKLLAQKHYWRDLTFDQLGELYISMLLRSLALSVIGIFVPVFLLKNGYDIQSVFLFFVLFFVGRTVMDVVGGYMVARVGPKHTMLVSYFAQIAASLLFLSLPDIHWPLILPAVLWGTANSLFFIAFHVDFSKVKHSKHGGKELGYMNIMERIGSTIGPLTGGILAYFFSPKYIFVGAIILLFIGLIPLFRTAEPTRTKQHLDFKNFNVDRLKHDYLSYAAFTVENNLCLVLWPVFLTLFVLGSNTFLELGAITSVGIFCSALASYYIGKLLDEKRGKYLFKTAIAINTAIYATRPFVTSLPFALGVNVVNEVVTVGYRIPYHKGMYDAADDLPGYRIVYLASMEAFGSFSKMIAWMVLYLLSGALPARTVIIVGFAIAAVGSLGILTQKFKALEYAKSNG